MGRTEVVEILLTNDDRTTQMIKVKNFEQMTGFMVACKWGKYGVVQMILAKRSIEMKEAYEGFNLACNHYGKKVIPLILSIDFHRLYILDKEKDNITINQSGMTEIQKPFEWKDKNRILIIHIDDQKNPPDIEMSYRPILKKTMMKKKTAMIK